MVTLTQLSLPLLSFSVSLVILIGILKSGATDFALDIPNERSLHSKPVSRLGGVATIAGISIALVWAGQLTLLSALLTLAVVSFVDDLRGLKAGVRLAVHLLVVGAYFWVSYGTAVPLIMLVVLIVSAVWLTNLYNFMDGIDGLAGGMSVIGFAAYGAGFFTAEQYPLAAVAFSIASASAAFLWFNFSPAKIYMGDVGSITMGFLAAALGTTGWIIDAWPIWFPLLVFSAFVADASLTLIKRLLRGERVWLAHREHYYQKLTLMGLGHKKAALLEYALITASCTLALLGLNLSARLQWVPIVIVLGLYGMLFLKVDSAWRRFAK